MGTVRADNDPPSFVLGGNQHLADNAGSQQVDLWATNIRPGPIGSETIYNEGGTNGQTLTFILSTDNDGLFVAGGEPAIDPATGHLTYRPAPESKGTANITVILRDDGQTETLTGTVETMEADPKQDPAPGAAT